MPPYTAPAPISSAVKIPEGLELAKCGREDCNGYVQVRGARRRPSCASWLPSILHLASLCSPLRARAAFGRETRLGRRLGIRLPPD